MVLQPPPQVNHTGWMRRMPRTDCHRFHNNDEDATVPQLTGYRSRAWLIGIISNPARGDFYGKRNDRMPAFAESQVLNAQAITRVTDWLRGE